MKQREKDQLHIEKQNQRLRKLIWDNIKTGLYALLLTLPLLPFVVSLFTTKPQGPVEATFVRCYKAYHCYVLETEEQGSFQLPNDLDKAVLRDVENGTIKPGDRMRITWHPWIIQGGVVMLTCGKRVYGDLKTWERWKKKTTRDLLIFISIFFLIGLLISIVMFYLDREEIAEIRRLKQKYRARQ